MSEKVRVGVIGCGNISSAYFCYAAKFPILAMVACADLNPQAARAKAQEHNIPRVCSVEELLEDPSIEVVLNLTVPRAHAPVTLAAIEKGKHTFLEKPLAISRDEGQQILDAARQRKVRVGCAPDTFMGAGLQTSRKLIDEGAIGRPISFTAFMMCPGHESWHPNPEFYYQKGGGPMFDMGPYYLTALLNLLGPVKRIFGGACITAPQRTITHRDKEGNPRPKFGQQMPVETPDHVCGMIEFVNGAIGNLIMTFATRRSIFPPLTLFGSEGTLAAPDPNGFDGAVRLQAKGQSEFADVPHAFTAGYGRALGLADMATAIRSGRKHRCSLEQAFTVLDLMQGFLDSSDKGRAFKPRLKYQRPAPMPVGLPFGILDP